MSDLKFYRYKAEQPTSIDIDGEVYVSKLSNPKMVCQEYDIVKETPKGYWIGWGDTKYKFILKVSKKKYAYPTKEGAMVNYIKRTESRIKILTSQLDFAKASLGVANDLQNTTNRTINIGDM
tara:strand:- start:959 stop:1324 length:366 start_codon:yes stop_codon:yes gene_type:complete